MVRGTRLNKGILLLVWILGASLWMGCTEAPPQWTSLGGELSENEAAERTTSFESFLSTAEGADVVLKGTIGKVCPAGCWFYLEGEGHITYVDVVGDFEMPESATGRPAWVVGKTNGSGGSRILQARQALLAPKAPEK